MDTEALSYSAAAKFIYDEMAGIKARDVMHFNVKGYSPITNDFAICTVDSDTQLKSLANGIERRVLKEVGIKPNNNGKASAANSGWVVLDYFDFMIHIFIEQDREYYSLERLWNMCESESIDIDALAAE